MTHPLKFLLIALFAFTLALPAHAFEAVTFKSGDGLEITILLFHQAGSSRGEYRNIAPRLKDMGYLVLAIDQRSGQTFGGITNETAARAKAKGLPDAYTDALPDMIAAISYARDTLGAQKLIIWGSSYSASLSLVIAGTQSNLIDGVLAFSPGEYFRGKPSVHAAAKTIKAPIFITAAKSESKQWHGIFNALPDKTAKIGYKPSGTGKHGSSALLSPNAPEYWTAVSTFLKAHFGVE